MGQLILSCAKTGRSFKSGFQVSRDDLGYAPPKWRARMMCGVCHRVHEFNFAEAKVCECPTTVAGGMATVKGASLPFALRPLPREAASGHDARSSKPRYSSASCFVERSAKLFEECASRF
jgi:hypothetical protein